MVIKKTILSLNLNELTHTERLILKFVNNWHKTYPPSASDVSKELGIPASTISTSLKRLTSTSHNKRKIFQWEPRHSITITEFGLKVAKHLEQHHHVFELFLHKELNISLEDAHTESNIIGPMVSCKVTRALIEKLNIKSWTDNCICPEGDHFCFTSRN